MKILISVSYYFPHISGLTNSIKNLAEALAQKHYAVSVLTTQYKKELLLHEDINEVHVERVPYLLTLQKGFIMPSFVVRAFLKVKKNDVLLINLPQIEGVIVAALGKLFGKRVISIYACEVKLPFSIMSAFIEKVLYVSHFLTLVLSDKVVALSDDYANHSKLLRHFKNKTLSIYPYVKAPVIARNEAISNMLRGVPSIARLPRFARNDKSFKIGFIGRISSEKGLEYLLDAVPLLKKKLGDKFVIFIAGPKAIGEELYVEEIKELAKKYENNVVFLPPLADEELGGYYQSLDVLVLPSINSTEAFGMVQVEAMLCGTPVVVTDLPGVRVPVQVTGMGRVSRCKDAADLAENIALVLTNKKDYIKSNKEIKKHFGHEEIVEKYREILV